MSIWFDHGMDFMGASRELKNIYAHLGNAQTEHAIDKSCTDRGIQWSFAPEHAAHFVGFGKRAVKNLKHHFQCIIDIIHFTLEELATSWLRWKRA